VSAFRVVLAIESSGPGGAERMVPSLAEALMRGGDQPTVATLKSGWMTQRAEAAGIPVWVEPQRRGLDLRWVFRFARRLSRERIDVLHTHEFGMNSYGGAAALLSRTPAISTIHGRHWVVDRRRRRVAYRLLRALGIPIIAVSRDLAGFLEQGLGLPRDRLEVVHNGIPIEPALRAEERAERRAAVRSQLGIPPKVPLLIAVGNLYPVKDHATLLHALSRLPDAWLAIAGRGDQEENLRRLASELGIAERVRLLGLRDDIPSLLAAGDVFVQPSRSEGLPLAVLEAMANQIPVVATDVGGVREVVHDAETGFLVGSGDPATMAVAVSRILSSPDRGASLAAAANARVREEFSVERMLSRYRALYTDRCRPRGGSAPACDRARH
jgi:glycosyltransferase involved in cell wall biosynthesis